MLLWGRERGRAREAVVELVVVLVYAAHCCHAPRTEKRIVEGRKHIELPEKTKQRATVWTLSEDEKK